PQHLQQGNQRQPNQRVGIAARQFVEQGNAQSLTFETARAVQRLFDTHIVGDLLRAERAEMHLIRLADRLKMLRAAVVQRQSGIEGDDIAAGLAQLFTGLLLAVRLARNLSVQYAYLIGTDDQVVGV